MDVDELFSQVEESDLLEALAEGLVRGGTHRILPANDDELWEFIAREYGFEIPRVAVCDGHRAPFDWMADTYFYRIDDSIFVGPRAGGKTLGMAIIDHLIMDHKGLTICSVGAIEAQAKKCYAYIDRFVNLPQFREALLKPSMISKTYLKNGGFIEVLAGTVNQVNSPHSARLHIDEVELAHPRVLEEAKSIPIRERGCDGELYRPATVYTSSRKLPYGPLEALLSDAPESGAAVYKFCLVGETRIETEDGAKALASVVEGERVWSFNGKDFELQPILWHGQTGVREIVKITFSDGATIECTPDHRIATTGGWREAGDFKPGQTAVSALREAARPAVSAQGENWPLHVMLSNREARTLPALLHRLRRYSGEIFDKALQPLSREAISRDDESARCGIRAEARSFAPSRYAIEGRDSGEEAAGHTNNSGRVTSGHRLANGGFSGTSLQNNHRGSWLVSRTREVVRDRPNPPESVKRNGIHSSRSLGSRNGSLGAPTPGLLQVISVERLPARPVFDITVSKTHSFVANGIVVHNCAFEIVEQCPEERHQNGVGCETCPLHDVCKEELLQPDGRIEYKPGPGRAARARGWLLIDDLIAKFKSLDRLVFDSQWLAKRPITAGLVFPMFEEETHVIDWQYNDAYPVVAGIDFGYVHPNVAMYAQILPNDEVVLFGEDSQAYRSDPAFAESIKREPWFGRTRWRVGDSAARSSRETLIEFGVANEPAAKEGTPEEPSSIKAGCDLMRYLFSPSGRDRPLLFVSRSCKTFIRQVKNYHYPSDSENLDANVKKEIPVKVDDDSIDAGRYLLMRLYRSAVVV
jgi:hypothetical protein